MSIKVMQWVWDHSSATHGALLVLLAIADCAADDGSHAFPSITELRRRSRLSERGVQESIAKLIEAGELERLLWGAPGKARSNMYRVIMRDPAESAPPQNLHPHPADSAGVYRADSAGETVSEPSSNRHPPGGGASAPADTVEEKPATAQTVLADWIDWLRSKGVELPKRTIGIYAKVIKEHLEQGFADKVVRRALARMYERGQHGKPTVLAGFVVEVQGNRSDNRSNGYQTATERMEQRAGDRQEVARLADAISAHLGADPSDLLMNVVIGKLAQRALKERSTACAPGGYIRGEWIESARRELTAGEPG